MFVFDGLILDGAFLYVAVRSEREKKDLEKMKEFVSR